MLEALNIHCNIEGYKSFLIYNDVSAEYNRLPNLYNRSTSACLTLCLL